MSTLGRVDWPGRLRAAAWDGVRSLIRLRRTVRITAVLLEPLNENAMATLA
ncbi:MAG: hypothetical protein IID39_08940 [Planctomycetes bacterium]|nr:hypothetical protein [Planctomycetota bacterium]